MNCILTCTVKELSTLAAPSLNSVKLCFFLVGFLTGKCDNDSKICLAHAWCPIEQENVDIT